MKNKRSQITNEKVGIFDQLEMFSTATCPKVPDAVEGITPGEFHPGTSGGVRFPHHPSC